MQGWVRVDNSYGSWLLMVGLDMVCRNPIRNGFEAIFLDPREIGANKISQGRQDLQD